MYINDSLHLVVPVRSDDKGPLIHAYHNPISRDVFEANYRILAATKAQLASKGIIYQMDSGPRIAAMVLRDEGIKDSADRADLDEQGKPRDGNANALLAEIKRLTTILAPGPSGWETLPVDTAVAQGIIDSEEWGEALSALVFFTCHYALARKVERQRMADATSSILQASITSLTLSEFAASLPISTKAETTPRAASSVPS
jgi:hypothetical protein